MKEINEITISHPNLSTRTLKCVASEDNTYDVGVKSHRIGLIIPTRGDRPEFISNLKRLIRAQKLPPFITILICLVDYPIETESKDITQRYRRGYDSLRNKNIDVVFFLEDDDFYAHNYINKMFVVWISAGRPEIFGLTHTTYYHIGLRAYFEMHHTQRSSAMCTMVKPDMNFDWPDDSEPYTDTHLWMSARHKETGKPLTQGQFTPDPLICLGIKNFHEGLTGGNMHNDRLHRYDPLHNQYAKTDHDLKYLSSIVDPVSLEFYKSFYKFDCEKL